MKENTPRGVTNRAIARLQDSIKTLTASQAAGNLSILENAGDTVKTFAYLDAGTSDERVSTITYTSPVEFPAITVVKTFVYAGTSGGYRVSTITLS